MHDFGHNICSFIQRAANRSSSSGPASYVVSQGLDIPNRDLFREHTLVIIPPHDVRSLTTQMFTIIALPQFQSLHLTRGPELQPDPQGSTAMPFVSIVRIPPYFRPRCWHPSSRNFCLESGPIHFPSYLTRPKKHNSDGVVHGIQVAAGPETQSVLQHGPCRRRCRLGSYR